MLQATPEFLGASHWSWVPIRQDTGPRGTSWEPFAPGGSGRGLWARSRKERVLAGLAAKRGRRKTGAEQVRAPDNLPNRHPSRRTQSPKKPGRTGLSAVEIEWEIGKLRLRENRRSLVPESGWSLLLSCIKHLRACPRGSFPSQRVDISDGPFSTCKVTLAAVRLPHPPPPPGGHQTASQILLCLLFLIFDYLDLSPNVSVINTHIVYGRTCYGMLRFRGFLQSRKRRYLP